ncbi:MAG: amidase [Rhodospirillaceae bacterium]
MSYSPSNNDLRSWFDAIPAFCDGSDTPRAYLERCIQVIEARENTIKAFVSMDVDSARNQADQSTSRYREGRALSGVDGMPYGVKDLFKTSDFPTAIGSSIFEGKKHWADSAHVFALKKLGAVLLGKTTLPELGSGEPPPTRNPYDLTRSPGGSSSGSAAAVGAGMVPAASGSQGRGSILRPASFCGNWALKPTLGALHSGGLLWRSPSYSVMGVHAGTLDDCWLVATSIAQVVGGDPGYPGLYGANNLLNTKPRALGILETAGWDLAEDPYKERLFGVIDCLSEHGVKIVTRHGCAEIEALEQALTLLPTYRPRIAAWDIKWPASIVREIGQNKVTPRLLKQFEENEKITLEEYRDALISLAELRDVFEAASSLVDGFITLSSPGMPPVGIDTGDSIFGDPSSALGAPALNLPLLEDRGLPMGIQLLGQPHNDFKLAQIAKWLATIDVR